MRLKLLFIIGLVAGYIVGARAGRARYEQIRAAANDVWEDPRVQKAVTDTQEFVKDNAPLVAEKVAEGAKVASEKVAEGAKVAATSVAEGTRVAAAGAKDVAGKVAETAKSVTGRGSDDSGGAAEHPVGTAESDWVEVTDPTADGTSELGAESLESADAIWVDSTDPATAHEVDPDGSDASPARHAADDTDDDTMGADGSTRSA